MADLRPDQEARQVAGRERGVGLQVGRRNVIKSTRDTSPGLLESCGQLMSTVVNIQARPVQNFEYCKGLSVLTQVRFIVRTYAELR